MTSSTWTSESCLIQRRSLVAFLKRSTVFFIAVIAQVMFTNVAQADGQASPTRQETSKMDEQSAQEDECDSPKIADLTPTEILDRMKETYANCKTYQDTGSVTSTFPAGQEIKKPFWTAFIRPDQFRYEFQDSFEGDNWRFIIAQNKSMIENWIPIRIPPYDKMTSLKDGLELIGHLTKNNNVSTIVPWMLRIEGDAQNPFIRLSKLKRLNDSTVESVECFSIEGSSDFDHPSKSTTQGKRNIKVEASKDSVKQKIWIDKTSFLLIRIEENHTSDSTELPSYKSTITYKPTINAEVPEEKLKFDPPEKE